jgi:hypothetical protein
MGEAGKTYWLDSFTGTTWREFLDAGGEITGFRASRRKIAGSIKPGDVFLCYLTGVKRWVGALEVIEPTDAGGQIWSFEAFPVRFRVKPLVLLTPETGVPMEQLEGKVWFFTKPEDAPGYKAFVRSSPNRFKKPADGALLMDLLKAAEANPVKRKVSQAALNRKPYFRAETQIGKKTVSTVVSVPDAGDEAAGDTEADETKTPSDHLRLQANLLAIGAEMGLDVWVARNDRGRVYEGQPLGEFENMLDDLPTQFNEATQATIELIDVLWLKGNSIVAAFEIECTTSVYSGLLRMSDLLALQPNLDIKLYIVAPDDRRDKVDREIKRPTFMLRPKPLNTVCGFLPFSTLMEKVEGIRKLGIAGSLSPGFLEKTAEYFNIAE